MFNHIEEQVKQQGGEVVTISTSHEHGQRLKKMTDVAALLRYNIN